MQMLQYRVGMLFMISAARLHTRVCAASSTPRASLLCVHVRKLTTMAAQKPSVGWIGTGVMGKSMVGHLLSAGYPCSVYNRTTSKAEALQEKGATVAPSIATLTKSSDIVFLIVGYPSDVRECVLGDNGVLANAKPGSIIVDMTTSEPALAQEIAQTASAKGVHSVDAPVSGGDIGARNAALSIMVGGDKAAVDVLHPLFSCMGKNIKHMGGPGMGQHTKMVNQVGYTRDVKDRMATAAHDRSCSADPDCHQYDRCMRGLAVRVQERVGPPPVHRGCRGRGSRKLEYQQPRPADRAG